MFFHSPTGDVSAARLFHDIIRDKVTARRSSDPQLYCFPWSKLNAFRTVFPEYLSSENREASVLENRASHQQTNVSVKYFIIFPMEIMKINS